MTYAELADALRVSTRTIRDRASRGMPTGSIGAAAAWSEKHVRPRYAEGPERHPLVKALADAEANDYASEAALRRLPAALRRAVLSRKRIGQVLDEVLAAHLEALREKGDPDAVELTRVLREAIQDNA